MNIREIKSDDINIWSQLRTKLWPDTDDNHMSEIQEYFNGNSKAIQQTFIIENENDTAVGFIELNIRELVKGSFSPLVPYVEGWYIDGPFQGNGYGKLLMKAAEEWAKQKGFSEIASDTETSNEKSISIHKRLGFRETERVVFFLKRLD